MSARSGLDDRLERLAEAGAARVGAERQLVVLALEVDGSSRSKIRRRISTYSRVRARGLAYGWPYQPSTTCGPERRGRGSNRPLDRWSRVIAVMAVEAGVRADIWADARAEAERRWSRSPPGQRA